MQPQQNSPAPKAQAVDLASQAADAAVSKANAPAEVAAAPVEPVKPQDVDLDSLETFVFQGKKYTPEDLRNEIMMRKDYTNKTKELAKNKKFDENLKYDLQFVRQNPQLADRFKQTYPERYHDLLDVVLKRDQEEVDAGRRSAESELDELPRPLQEALEKVKLHENKLEEINNFFFEQKVQANQALVDSIFDAKSQKYPFANTDAVLNKAQSLLNMNKDNEDFEMTDAVWERIFKLDHQDNEKRFSELYKKRVDEQLQKGEKAKDSGPGGLAPGREKKKIALEDVADLVIQDLTGR